MKDNMNLIKEYVTKNRCFLNAVKIKIKKLVLHSYGCPQPNPDVCAQQMNNVECDHCVHAFIGADKIIQTMPWDRKGWHVGKGSKGSYNNCSIGVEICEPSGFRYKPNSAVMVGYDVAKNQDYFNKVYHNAVELFAMLCKKYKLNPLTDIVCHCEAHALGYASNHADVMHWFPKHGKSMDTFRADVKTLMDKENPQYKTYPVVKGDTLCSISRALLGNSNRYPEIKKLNNLTGDDLEIGQILKIPVK